jgi:hypothetical protein
MSALHPKVLLVEGDEDKRVIPYLMEANGVRWGERKDPKAVYIEAYGGVEKLLEPAQIETQLKASGLEALGVLIDADEDPVSRWQAVRHRALKRFPGLPPDLPATGLVHAEDGLRFGVWIMPDNQRRGMLETFLTFLRPADNPALNAHALEACRAAKTLAAPYKDAHADKAHLHTWLAFQDPPGRQLHQAVLERLLDPSSPHAAPFLAWFKALFALP